MIWACATHSLYSCIVNFRFNVGSTIFSVDWGVRHRVTVLIMKCRLVIDFVVKARAMDPNVLNIQDVHYVCAMRMFLKRDCLRGYISRQYFWYIYIYIYLIYIYIYIYIILYVVVFAYIPCDIGSHRAHDGLHQHCSIRSFKSLQKSTKGMAFCVP